jgi:hypothetical protein
MEGGTGPARRPERRPANWAGTGDCGPSGPHSTVDADLARVHAAAGRRQPPTTASLAPMSTLLILLVLAVAAYLVFAAVSGPRRRAGNSVAEFSRALDALNPQRARRPSGRPPSPPHRSQSRRRPAA